MGGILVEAIVALIIEIAVANNVPPAFALAIAYTENATLDADATYVNKDGSIDCGIMQLNSQYFGLRFNPVDNVRTAIKHIKELMDICDTYWAVAVAYNAGLSRLRNPPNSSIDYANEVMDKTAALHGRYFNPVIRRGR
jgi:soluble lytic murein transglycosylase-like protein